MLDGLHNEKKLSLLQISKKVGRSYTAIWGLCRALQIPTRTVAEAQSNSAESRSKHKRSPFDGTEEDRAYMLGFKNGDLTAWQVSGTAVMVTSSTTHPAFADLFHQLFGEYGHVYKYPMFEEGKGHKWKVAARLDNSFRFLLMDAVRSLDQFSHRDSSFWSWLAGIIDSDGHIQIGNSSGYARVRLTIGNTDLPLLQGIESELAKRGYNATGPYLHFARGTVTPGWKVRYSKDMWRLGIQSTPQSQAMLKELPLRHREKVEKKALALSISPAMRWAEVELPVLEISKGINDDVRVFLAEAEELYLERRSLPKKH